MFRAFLRSPGGIVGVAFLLVLIVLAIIAPILWTKQAAVLDFTAVGSGPTLAHPLGTDQLGRDTLLRMLVATRISLVLALAATGIGAVIGLPLGAVAANLPSRLRTIVLRIIDALLSFPVILVAIFVGAILGPGPIGAVIGVALALAFSFARLSSTLALTIGGLDYMAAARVMGISRGRLLIRYVLPNIAETLANGVAFTASGSIVAVSSLSFLGLGVQPPSYDWGQMLTDGVTNIFATPFAALAPAAAIAVSALAFGFTGEAIARATNPRLWTASHGRRGKSASQPVTRLSTDWVEESADLVLKVRDLCVTVDSDRGVLRIVDGVSFNVAKGNRIGIVGESGSGKTSTAMAIAALVPQPAVMTGVVELDGRDVAGLKGAVRDHFLGTTMGLVYQDPMSSLNPALRIGTQLTEGAREHRHLSAKDALALAISRLKEVGMPNQKAQMKRHPHELSGGMRQRVMIAMGLMNEPSILIADEPTTALDVTVQAQVMDVLDEANRTHGTAFVLITHNMGLVSQNCDRILVMYAGRIVEEMTTEQLLQSPRHPYTRALVAAVPSTARPRSEVLQFIPGNPPDLAARPTGCAYRDRCPLAMPKCATDDPGLERIADGRRVACWAVDDELNAAEHLPVEEVA